MVQVIWHLMRDVSVKTFKKRLMVGADDKPGF